MTSKKVVIIGSGLSGLSAACYLAKEGYSVEIYEKNEAAGGRIRIFKEKGYTFDMGPSWYWMPEVFEKFFNNFGKKVSDYYELERLDPSYRVFFDKKTVDVPAQFDDLKNLFEELEPGSSNKLDKFIEESKYKYKMGMEDYAKRPSLSIFEFVDFKFIFQSLKLGLVNSFAKYIRKFFKNKYLLQILEFPVLFLGATPAKTPSLYSLMNYADLILGTWYPKGGMIQLPLAMENLAKELGVKFHYNSEITKIIVKKNNAQGIFVNGEMKSTDIIIAACDYEFADQKLLPQEYSNYDKNYWESRIMSPSAVLYFIGVKKKIKNLLHHNLFFDKDFDNHATEIYDKPNWPSDPLFYLCVPSKTDNSVVPDNHENLFILIPVASGLENDQTEAKKYLEKIIKRIELKSGDKFCDEIDFVKAYSISDFVKDYNSFKGNAYGLANTLFQTAYFKPSIKNKRLKNFYYAGQLTVPGPGMPTCVLSGEIVSKLITKEWKLTV